MKKYVIKIKDLEIPYCIKNYKSSKTIKIYFKEDILTITKSPYVAIKEAQNFIYQNEEDIYKFYKKVYDERDTKKSNWGNGQQILYRGEFYTIETSFIEQEIVNININH